MPELEATYRALPPLFWIAPLCWSGIAALWTTLALLVAKWIALRGAPNPSAHWSERARARFTANAASLTTLVVALLALPWLTKMFGSTVHFEVGLESWVLVGFGVIVGGVISALMARPMLRRRGLSIPADGKRRLLDFVPVLVLLVALGGLAIVLRPWLALVIGAVLTAVYSRWGWLALLGAMGSVARSSRLDAIARPMLRRARLEEAAIFEFRSPFANAFALPLARVLLVTSPAMEHLADDELTSILAHEIGHLKEAGTTSWGRVFTMSVIFPSLAVAIVALGRNQPALCFATVMLAIVALLLGRQINRRAEKRADEHAIDDSGGPIYGRALERIYEINLIPAVLVGSGGSHGHLYDRLVRAGGAPVFERPAPPARPMWPSLGASLLLVGAFFGTEVALDRSLRPLARVAFGLADASEVDAFARERYLAKDMGVAAAFYRALADSTPDQSVPVDNLSLVLAVAGRCDEARATHLEAIRRSQVLLTRDEATREAEFDAADGAVDALRAYCHSND